MNDFEHIIGLTICSKTERLKVVRCAVQCAAEMIGCRSDTANQIVIAVNEACMNVMQHAYAGKPDGLIKLDVYHKDHEIMFRLTDYGQTPDKNRLKPRDLSEIRPGGLGIHMISEIMDTINYSSSEADKSNVLEITKKI